MQYQNNEWIAAYYPSEMISNPRSRVIMGLLFDKVICHFPISSMSCGGGSGISYDLFGEDPLVEAGVFELNEDYLMPGIGEDDEDFNKYFQLQVTAMALDICKDNTFVPITDDPSWPVPISLLEGYELKRLAYLHASALAIQSLAVALPPLANIPDEDILKAREELIEQLIPFRRAMMALAPTVRSGIENEAQISDVHYEARYIVETQVAPALGELRDKIAKENGKFWRKLLLKGSAVVPQFILNWTTKGALIAAVEAIGDAKELTVDIIDRDNLLNSLKRQGGLGYLLAVAEHPRLQPKK